MYPRPNSDSGVENKCAAAMNNSMAKGYDNENYFEQKKHEEYDNENYSEQKKHDFFNDDFGS